MNEQEFLAALAPLPEPTVSYRLYYGDSGEPLFFSMEDLPGKYITVDRETYVSAPLNIRVINGTLQLVDTVVAKKLKPSSTGTPCHPQDVSIVVKETEPHTKWSLA